MTSAPPSKAPRRPSLAVTAGAILFVLMPFLVWHETWFGRRLTDADLVGYFSDRAHPRHIQHALAQVADRMTRRDPAAARWYPQVVAASHSRSVEVRNTAAWAMGNDPGSEMLHAALRDLLGDADVHVRRNAALALARFHDPAGRAELAAMLRPLEVRAAQGGEVRLRTGPGREVRQGSMIARVRTDGGRTMDVIAPAEGTVVDAVADGGRVPVGAPILVLSPAVDEMWEALRGLYLVGAPGDLPAVEKLAAEAGLPERVRQQATLTARAIRTRPAPNSSR